MALIGPSGSGKSTLLRHTSGLVVADKGCGCVTVFGQTVQKNGRVSYGIREIRANIGFIFQQFNLVDRLSLLQNVLVGMITRVPVWRSLAGLYTKAEKQSAMSSLFRVGLHEEVSQRASTLSGGQQQRAAIARTMEQRAKIILADEPIASLDPESARTVMDCLAQLNREDKVTVVVSLHQVRVCHAVLSPIGCLKRRQNYLRWSEQSTDSGNVAGDLRFTRCTMSRWNRAIVGDEEKESPATAWHRVKRSSRRPCTGRRLIYF